MALTQQDFEYLFPLACQWAAEQERLILQTGVALTVGQMADAHTIGVVHTEQVRLLRVPQIQAPANPILAMAARTLISPRTAGLTLRYGIIIRDDCWGDRYLVAHELTHTRQYEQHGGLEKFLRPYLLECFFPPYYPNGPLEQEAARIGKEVGQ